MLLQVCDTYTASYRVYCMFKILVGDFVVLRGGVGTSPSSVIKLFLLGCDFIVGGVRTSPSSVIKLFLFVFVGLV